MPINPRQKEWLRIPAALTKKISKETARAYLQAIQYCDKSDVSRGLGIVPELDRRIKGTVSGLSSKLFRRLSMASEYFTRLITLRARKNILQRPTENGTNL